MATDEHPFCCLFLLEAWLCCNKCAFSTRHNFVKSTFVVITFFLEMETFRLAAEFAFLLKSKFKLKMFTLRPESLVHTEGSDRSPHRFLYIFRPQDCCN